MPKAELKIQKHGGYGIDYKIPRPGNIPGEIWWSPAWDGKNGQGSHGGFNSYVVAEGHPPCYDGELGKWKVGDKWVQIYSINGIGEIRWVVMHHDIAMAERAEEEGRYEPWSHEGMEAARYFGLEP